MPPKSCPPVPIKDPNKFDLPELSAMLVFYHAGLDSGLILELEASMITNLVLALQLFQVPAVCSVVERRIDPGVTQFAFETFAEINNGNTAAANRDTEDWLKMDGEVLLFWALWSIRNDNPVRFDEVFKNYGLYFDANRHPLVLGPRYVVPFK